MRRYALVLAVLCLGAWPATTDEDGPALREKLRDISADLWIYDDMDAATAKAEKDGKPILLCFR